MKRKSDKMKNNSENIYFRDFRCYDEAVWGFVYKTFQI